MAVKITLSPRKRNPIEAEFGQANTGCGLDSIKAWLQDTSKSSITSIFLGLNLAK